MLRLEPGNQQCLTEVDFDSACRVLADFTDIKTPYTLNHSSGVAHLAAAAARRYGLAEAEARDLYRAGMLHDIGITGISGGILAKPGPLSASEWERVRLHSYYTERILAHSELMAPLGLLASSAHERLDNSGYHRGANVQLSPAARSLAAADAYQAMTELRPYRPALSGEQAAQQLQQEGQTGRLDQEAVRAVLEVAGHAVLKPNREAVAGLSGRELEVLQLIARGHTIKKIANSLSISPKTADRHIQNIYGKIGVSSRAAATLFAMQHNLINQSN